MLIKLRNAQSTAEYAILIALVIAGAVGIQNTVRRAWQSRVHQAAMALSGGQEYEPATGLKTTTEQTQNRTRNEHENVTGTSPWIEIDEESKVTWGSTEQK